MNYEVNIYWLDSLNACFGQLNWVEASSYTVRCPSVLDI